MEPDPDSEYGSGPGCTDLIESGSGSKTLLVKSQNWLAGHIVRSSEMAGYKLRMAIRKELRDVCLLTMSFNWLAVLFKELRFTGDEPNLASFRSKEMARWMWKGALRCRVWSSNLLAGCSRCSLS
jgi:hypothetical protein